MKISLCTTIGCSFGGIMLLVLLIIAGPAFYIPKHQPHTPMFNLDSVALQHIDMSSYHVNADWDFIFSIDNTNQFGWSYGLTAYLYHDDIYEYGFPGRGIKVRTYIKGAIIPTFNQAGNNRTAFTARFEGVSMPVNNEWSTNNRSGGNSEFSIVELELSVQRNLEPIPRRSLSWFMRWYVNGIDVTCANVKIGISSDSTGVAQVYRVCTDWGNSCYSSWDSFWL